MLQCFKEHLDRTRLLSGDKKLILALSGGVDSMVLADLLMKCDVGFVVAHCNFHLRGTESDGDERFVRDFAAAHGLTLYVKEFDTEAYAKTQGVSIEMAARDLRYAWFEELRRQLGFDFVAVAHHSDDQLETFFINLLRGAGIRGLKGMQAVNGSIIRPMLEFSREEIRQYAIDNHLSWREDHTNAETLYLRNKIRHELLPVIDSISKEGRGAILKSIQHLSSENELYRDLVREKLSQQVVEQDDSTLRLPRQVATQEQLLFEWLRDYGFNTDQVHFIHDALDGQPGKCFFSPTHRLVIERGSIELSPIGLSSESAQRHIQDHSPDLESNHSPDFVPSHSSVSLLTLSPGVSLKLSFQLVTRDGSFVIAPSPEVAQVDYDKLAFPLKLRKWQAGDRFHPLGMKGSKLLSDFFVDQKMSTRQKEQCHVLTTADNQIVWVVGRRIDDRFKVTETTKSILKVWLS